MQPAFGQKPLSASRRRGHPWKRNTHKGNQNVNCLLADLESMTTTTPTTNHRGGQKKQRKQKQTKQIRQKPNQNTNKHTHTYIHAHVHTRTRTYTHTYIHAHAQAENKKQKRNTHDSLLQADLDVLIRAIRAILHTIAQVLPRNSTSGGWERQRRGKVFTVAPAWDEKQWSQDIRENCRKNLCAPLNW